MSAPPAIRRCCTSPPRALRRRFGAGRAGAGVRRHRAGLDTDSSAAHNDGITSNYHISVSGTPLTEWHYSVNGMEFVGSGSGFDLEDGTYNAGQIQVWQTVGGIDSAHTSIGKTW
jgi:hypothetical protein